MTYSAFQPTINNLLTDLTTIFGDKGFKYNRVSCLVVVISLLKKTSFFFAIKSVMLIENIRLIINLEQYQPILAGLTGTDL